MNLRFLILSFTPVITLIFCAVLNVSAQDQRFRSAKFVTKNVSGTAPNFTVTGNVQDTRGIYSASDFQNGDKLTFFYSVGMTKELISLDITVSSVSGSDITVTVTDGTGLMSNFPFGTHKIQQITPNRFLQQFAPGENDNIRSLSESDNTYKIDTIAGGGALPTELTLNNDGNLEIILSNGDTLTEYIGGGGGGGIGGDTIYSAGTDAYVWANAPGVTFSKNATTGEFTFTVPDTVVVKSAWVAGVNTDANNDNDIFVAFDYSGTRTFNQSLATAWIPKAHIQDTSGTPSRSSPVMLSLLLQQGVSAIGSNDIEIALVNAGNIFTNFMLKFSF